MSEVEGAAGKDYFGASFVKLVESAGGRAIPVLEDMTTPDLLRLLDKINGFVLPGGDANLKISGYARISKVRRYVYKRVTNIYWGHDFLRLVLRRRFTDILYGSW